MSINLRHGVVLWLEVISMLGTMSLAKSSALGSPTVDSTSYNNSDMLLYELTQHS